MNAKTHPYFVSDDAAGTRRETAVLLVGTASEFGIDQRAVRAVRGGFRISQEIADVLYDEDEPEAEPRQAEPEPEPQPEPEPEPEPDPEVSGNPEPEPEPEPEPKRKARAKKKTSGNRAAKNATDKGE